jgi:hypothetical protein
MVKPLTAVIIHTKATAIKNQFTLMSSQTIYVPRYENNT